MLCPIIHLSVPLSALISMIYDMFNPFIHHITFELDIIVQYTYSMTNDILLCHKKTFQRN